MSPLPLTRKPRMLISVCPLSSYLSLWIWIVLFRLIEIDDQEPIDWIWGHLSHEPRAHLFCMPFSNKSHHPTASTIPTIAHIHHARSSDDSELVENGKVKEMDIRTGVIQCEIWRFTLLHFLLAYEDERITLLSNAEHEQIIKRGETKRGRGERRRWRGFHQVRVLRFFFVSKCN